MKIGYSTKPDRTDFKEITDGQNLPQGNLYIEVREVTPTVNFTLKKLDGTVVHTKSEGQTPYDLHGGNAWPAPVGDYSLTVKDKTSEKTVTFRVGEVTPPPPPPPTKEVVTVDIVTNHNPEKVDLKVTVNGQAGISSGVTSSAIVGSAT